MAHTLLGHGVGAGIKNRVGLSGFAGSAVMAGAWRKFAPESGLP